MMNKFAELALRAAVVVCVITVLVVVPLVIATSYMVRHPHGFLMPSLAIYALIETLLLARKLDRWMRATLA
jgi:hypothetical protein